MKLRLRRTVEIVRIAILLHLLIYLGTLFVYINAMSSYFITLFIIRKVQFIRVLKVSGCIYCDLSFPNRLWAQSRCTEDDKLEITVEEVRSECVLTLCAVLLVWVVEQEGDLTHI